MPIKTPTVEQDRQYSHLDRTIYLYDHFKELYENKLFKEWMKLEIKERERKHNIDFIRINMVPEEGRLGAIAIQAKYREMVDLLHLPEKRKKDANDAEEILSKLKEKK